MINNIGWQGIWKIRVVDKKTGKAEETLIKNRVMNAALDELLKVLQGTATNMQIKYLALGTNSAALTDSQTQLGAEIFRTLYATQTKTDTGELTSEFIVLDSEAVGTIEEIGVFGGTTATGTANSGTLISRILWHKVKSNSEEIQFTRVDRIIRG
jgi:hypothetical protein